MSTVHKAQWFTIFMVDYCFCPSKRAWDRELREIGITADDCDVTYPTFTAAVTRYEKGDTTYLFVTLEDAADKRKSKYAVLAMLAHEAVHVWQHLRRTMREKKPSTEFEAYSIQQIAQNLWWAYSQTRKGGKYL